jgi:protein O-mannosyl-transferase
MAGAAEGGLMEKLWLPAALTLVLAAALVPHLPALSASFTYDDHDFVVRNASLRSLDDALASFGASFPPSQPGRGLYRPLTNLSYALDLHLWGDGAVGFHLASLIYYLLTALLVLLLARRYLRLPAALAGALLFALHPVHCEAVDSIAGRSEILALLLALGSLLSFLRHLEAARAGRARARLLWLGLSLLLYAAGLLAKETAAVLPGVLFAHLLLFGRGSAATGRLAASQRHYYWLLPYLALLAGYVLLRSAALEGALLSRQAVLTDASTWTWLSTVGAVFAAYCRLLVAPEVLQVDLYYERAVGLQQGITALGLTGLLLLTATVAALLLSARRGVQSTDGDATGDATGDSDAAVARRAAMALALLLVFLFPYSHVVPFGALMAERFLFAPSVGFALLVGLAFGGLLQRTSGRPLWRWPLWIGLALLLALAGARSYTRSSEWRDSVTLWSSARAATGEDHRILSNLAAGMLERGAVRRALPLLQRSFELQPDHVRGWSNLGYAHLLQGELDRAQQVLTRLVTKHPDYAPAHNHLGVIALKRGDRATARRRFNTALRLDPNFLFARCNLRRLDKGGRGRTPSGCPETF